MFQHGNGNDYTTHTTYGNAIASERELQCIVQWQRNCYSFGRNFSLRLQLVTERWLFRNGHRIVRGKLHLHDHGCERLYDHPNLYDLPAPRTFGDTIAE